MRVALTVVGAWTLSLRAPRETAIVRAQYLGLQPLHDHLLAPWQHFDALWYVRVAMNGYGAHDGSTVYFPLYPLLIKIAAVFLCGNMMLAALVVSNLCFYGLLVALYWFVAARHDAATARRALLFLCAFPTASFLLGAYTESLFLLLTLSCFQAVDYKRPMLAGTLSFLAALTRIQGAALALPLLWIAVESWREGRREARPFIAATLPMAGALSFVLYVRLALHGGLVTTTFAHQWHMAFNPPWVTLGADWAALDAHHWQLFRYQTGNWVDAMNIVLALSMLALLVPARRTVGTALWLYGLATWVVTLTLHQSTARYMLTVFPAFIALAVWTHGRWPIRISLMFGVPAMLFVASEFARWSFVG